jgi:excisionase family DNA binding protein
MKPEMRSVLHMSDVEEVRSAMTIHDVADRLGCSVRTLYSLRSGGGGPRGFRVGRELRFDPEDVESWIAARKAADRGPAPAA